MGDHEVKICKSNKLFIALGNGFEHYKKTIQQLIARSNYVPKSILL